MTAKTVREICDDRALMTLVSNMMESRPEIREEWLAHCRANSQYGQSLNVMVSIDGFELDWDAYIANIRQQWERMLVNEAEALVTKMIDQKVLAPIHELHDAAMQLGHGIRREAARLLGFDSSEEE